MQTPTKPKQEEDKIKEQKLYLYIISSIQEYQQGNKTRFNQILDEISNRNKVEDMLRLWMKALIKTILESKENKQIICVLAVNILKKCAWFYSDNHIKIYDIFEKFILTLLSLNNTHLDLVYRYLLEHIDINEKEPTIKQEELEVMIGSKSFHSQEDLLKYIRTEILSSKKYSISSEIIKLDEGDSSFMHEIFKHHKHYQQKFEHFKYLGIGEFTYKEKKSKCFFVCSDSEDNAKPVDISYLKTVQYLFENLRGPCEVFTENHLKRIRLITEFISKLLGIYPLSKENLISFMGEIFPHKRKSEVSLQLYLYALLRLSLLCPKLQNVILCICFEKLISIDVEIKLDDPLNFECFEDLSFTSSDENAKKLDCMMSLLFQYLELQLNPSKTTNFFYLQINVSNPSFYQCVLEIFQEKLLIIYQSKYVQFLIFYLCSECEKNPEFLEEFLSILITNCLKEKQAKIIRKNSISYLSSFLARAKYISNALLRKSMDFLIDFLENYSFDETNINFTMKEMKVLKPSKNTINNQALLIPNLHYLLILQALLYILCYQNTFLLDEGIITRLSNILLKTRGIEYLSIDILNEFELLCKKAGKLEIINILSSVNTVKNNENIDKKQRIELFFPFDPYLLRKSECFIRDIYRFWNDELPEEEEMKNNKIECEKETDSSSPFVNEEPYPHEHKRKLPVLADDKIIKKMKKT